MDGLNGFAGTLIFVSHDRWFVERLANRIVEITPDGVRDYRGTYEEYVRHCGDDHLDVERVVAGGRSGAGGERPGRGGAPETGGRGDGGRGPRRGRRGPNAWRRRRREARADEVAGRIEAAEGRVAEIDAVFAGASFYRDAGREEVAAPRGRAAVSWRPRSSGSWRCGRGWPPLQRLDPPGREHLGHLLGVAAAEEVAAPGHRLDVDARAEQAEGQRRAPEDLAGEPDAPEAADGDLGDVLGPQDA